MGLPNVEALIPRHSLAWRFRVRFADRLPPAEYLSPDIRRRDPGWGSEMFNRPIGGLEFYLPTGHVLVLAGMERYCFFVEAVQSMAGGGSRIEAFWFCGKPPGRDIVEMWRVGGGRIVRQLKPYGREWGGTAIRGWKRGAVGKVVSGIFRE